MATAPTWAMASKISTPGMTCSVGEVAAEELLIDADALAALGPLAGLVIGDPVHQQEGGR